jgi:hypothetical protein
MNNAAFIEAQASYVAAAIAADNARQDGDTARETAFRDEMARQQDAMRLALAA